MLEEALRPSATHVERPHRRPEQGAVGGFTYMRRHSESQARHRASSARGPMTVVATPPSERRDQAYVIVGSFG